MNKIPRETLAECLDLLEQGVSVEEILSRFPEQGDALRPFLDTAVQLSRLAFAPTLAAKRRSSETVLQAATTMRDRRGTIAPLWMALRRVLVPTVSFAALLLILGVVLPLISASALPGEGLYGAKRFVERVQVSLESNPDRRAALLASFNEERIREVEALLRDGRDAEVQFEGRIEELATDYWTVTGIRVDVREETLIEGYPQRMARVRVQGRTHDGHLTAMRLIVLGEQPVPDPTLEATLTPTATATGTATLTATQTPTATIAPQETSSPTLEPTAIVPETPAPIATSADSDTGNGNGVEDEANENGGDENENGNGGEDNGNENDDDNDNANGNNENVDNENENDNGGEDNGNENDDDNDNANDNNENEDNENEDNENENGGSDDNSNGNNEDNENS